MSEDYYRSPKCFIRDQSWVKEIVTGPSRLGYDSFRDYAVATDAFLSHVHAPVFEAVKGYWLSHIMTHDGWPPYKGDWRRTLAANVGNIAVRERFDPGEPSRYRYVGTRIAEMTGHDMTGRSVADYLPLPRTDVLMIEHLIHDEGRVCVTHRDYGNLNKGFMKAVAGNFLFADEHGAPRFNLTAGDFLIA